MRIGVQTILVALAVSAGAIAVGARGDDGERLLTIDHYVRTRSSVPSIAGQEAQLFVRERTKAATVLRGSSLAGRVAVFVHGAGTPGSVAFDVPHGDYSWMGYLANAGFDVFALDFSGYGRSTRPPAMTTRATSPPTSRRPSFPGFLQLPARPSIRTSSRPWDPTGMI